MTRLASLAGSPLRVVRPSIWKREFELLNEKERIGTLKFPSVFRREGVGECEEGQWVLSEKGIWKRMIVVLLPDREKPIASIELSRFALTNKLKLPHYRTLRLTRNLFKTSYKLTTSMNAALCSLKLQIFPKHTGEFTIDRKGEEYEELPWLVFLVWFVSILDQRNNAK